jgi:integrase
MKISTYDRKKQKGIATFLYFRWKGKKHMPLLGYNLSNEEKQDLALRMVERIQHPPVDDHKPKSSLTILEFAPVYYDRLAARRRIDRKRPKGIIENHLAKYFVRPMAMIQPEDCDDYVVHRQKLGASDGTIRREIGVLQRLLRLAVRRRMIPANPCDGIELPEQVKRERVATIPELLRLKKHADADMWRAIIIALGTGLREGKILAMEPKWIERAKEGRWVTLPAAQSRLKGTPKKSPLNRYILESVTSGVPFLHGSLFRRWKPRSFKKAWSVLCGRAKVDDLRFHDLRHTFTTWLREQGVVYEVRAALLGHKLPGKTADYTHEGPEWDRQLRQAVHTLDVYFAQIMSASMSASEEKTSTTPS